MEYLADLVSGTRNCPVSGFPLTPVVPVIRVVGAITPRAVWFFSSVGGYTGKKKEYNEQEHVARRVTENE